MANHDQVRRATNNSLSWSLEAGTLIIMSYSLKCRRAIGGLFGKTRIYLGCLIAISVLHFKTNSFLTFFRSSVAQQASLKSVLNRDDACAKKCVQIWRQTMHLQNWKNFTYLLFVLICSQTDLIILVLFWILLSVLRRFPSIASRASKPRCAYGQSVWAPGQSCNRFNRFSMIIDQRPNRFQFCNDSNRYSNTI